MKETIRIRRERLHALKRIEHAASKLMALSRNEGANEQSVTRAMLRLDIAVMRCGLEQLSAQGRRAIKCMKQERARK